MFNVFLELNAKIKSDTKLNESQNVKEIFWANDYSHK